MTQRLFTLTSYFFRRLTASLAGIIYTILALLCWALLFPPGQGTPDIDYYILVIGGFGAAMAFLATLTVSARANRAANYPLVVRLPSRVEYLAAVLLSSLLFATLLQLLVAGLALFRGPELGSGRLLEIPPIWLALNTLAAVLAMHASDFVTSDWSRVYVFGTLAILLLGQSASDSVGQWLAGRFAGLAQLLANSGWTGAGRLFGEMGVWFGDQGVDVLSRVFGFAFWPFHSMATAILDGHFEPTQALAPAIIMLYATILFMFAADFFAGKDLDFAE